MEFYLAQALSEHGYFNSFLKCYVMKHTLFECKRWNEDTENLHGSWNKVDCSKYGKTNAGLGG